MQIEPRLQNDISDFSQLVYKPAVNYHFNRTFAFSAGYKFIDKYHQANEHDLWQETHCNKKFGDLATGFQIRLEERFIDDIGGVIPRLRLLQHLSHPLGQSPNYVTGFGAIRLNLDNKGKGPVSGFEQSRIYAALGKPEEAFEANLRRLEADPSVLDRLDRLEELRTRARLIEREAQFHEWLRAQLALLTVPAARHHVLRPGSGRARRRDPLGRQQ